jgi:predicted nucleic acid-binding protein
MALVLDTGPVLAALDLDDPQHESCAALIADCREPLVVVAPTLVEIDYWIRKKLSLEVWLSFVEDLESGVYRLEQLSPCEVLRAAELEREYADLDLGFVDAAVVAVCERLRETKVATLDRRHFATVRPAHCRALEILPDSYAA